MGYSNSLLAAGVLLVGATLSSQASAQNNDLQPERFLSVTQSLGLIKNVFLLIDNKAADGCWSNAEQVRKQTQQTLEHSGFTVYDEPLLILSPLSSNLIITAQGSRSREGTCYGSIQIESYRSVLDESEGVQIQYQGRNFSQSTVAHGRKNLNAAFLSATATQTTAFTAAVEANRKSPIVSNTFAKLTAQEIKPLPVRVLADVFRNVQANTPP